MWFVSLREDEFLSFILSKPNKDLIFLMQILRNSSSSEGNSPDFKKTKIYTEATIVTEDEN